MKKKVWLHGILAAITVILLSACDSEENVSDLTPITPVIFAEDFNLSIKKGVCTVSADWQREA